MAEIKWIKIATDLFDDEKILLLETLPEADSLIVIWIKLLCLAGRQNNGGVFLINGSIPYKPKMLARVFRRDEELVEKALEYFEEFGLIEFTEDVITIPNWEKHQNIDGMERIREQNRIRNAEYRERQREKLENDVTETSRETSRMTSRDGTEGRRKKEDKEIKEKEEEKEKTPIADIVELYNEMLNDVLPTVLKVTDARRAAIRARWQEYKDLAKFTTVFYKARHSAFLTGQNDRKWTADFDWLMKPTNFTKVLEGKYDDRKTEKEKEKGSFNTADFFKAAVNRRA